MWRKEDVHSQTSTEVPPQTQSGSTINQATSSLSTVSRSAPACVSQGIKIKGEVTGTEDLFIDGRVEGKISLAHSGLTVGPNGVVKGDIIAREIVFRGVSEGKFTADERIQIWHSARVHGELKSERISIEDGAELRGKVEAGKLASKDVASAKLAGPAKKGEQGKVTEAAKDANIAPDAATAGAD
jgi:cytoskeletal protein CcmA (bactofilin family)